ncbi:MAG: type IX secretion system membrane protein PorP/SprF [Bacteroidia bacterium]|nr:type IX secretion system membrane protein PorP/SprF [Bacteroidia bacterium]
MRRLLCILALGLIHQISIWGQQQAQYTQFMFNKLWMNPGYAASGDEPCLNILSRNQWLGFDGAPVSQAINYHTPLKKQRVGLGISLNHDQLGPTNTWTLSGNYAYRIPTSVGKLSIGVQGSITDFGIKFNELSGLQDGDGIVADEYQRKLLTNFGAGLYFTTKKYFLGVSIPFLLQNDISFNDGSTQSAIYGQQVIHWYIMGGALLRISQKIKAKPAFLAKFAKNAPSDLDLNFSLIFLDRLWTGLSYRFGGSTRDSFGESIDLILQYQLGWSFRLGVAYDYALTELQNHNNGSLEFMLQYCFNKKSEEITNPRFF